MEDLKFPPDAPTPPQVPVEMEESGKNKIQTREERIWDLLSMVRRPEDQLSLALLAKGLKPGCLLRDDVFAFNVVQMLKLPYYQIQKPIYFLVVAKDQETLDKLKHIDELNGDLHDFELGKTLGYPPTAIMGFMQRKSLPLEKLPEKVQKSGILEYINFMFSKDNWREELETLKNQIRAVKDIDPELYNKVNWEMLKEAEKE